MESSLLISELLLVKASFFYAKKLLLIKALFKDILNIFTELWVVSEETPDEIICQKLIKEYHLDKIDVKV